MDVNRKRPILIGESEVRGDPTTIPIPNHPGFWCSILGNIPPFLEHMPSEDIPCGKKRSKATPIQKSKSVAIVVPTTVLQSKGCFGLGSSWSPKKKVRGVAKKLLKGISVQKEEDKSEDTMQKESTTTISCKGNDPMSIAAILKNPTTNDTIQSSKVETIAESSTTGARNQDTTVIKTPPTV